MRYVIADPSKPIEIGYERDAKTMNVHFDVSDFIKDYPGCTCHLSYIRPTVTQPYEPENTRIIGSELVWNVSAADAEFSGYGSAQIVMFRNSDQVAHSPEMTVHVNESHDSTAEPPEEPIQAWFVRVMAAQDEAKDLAEKVLSMTVEVETLPAGSQATASYDPATGIMTIGIPVGHDGLDGFSPAVTITDTETGHIIKITDKDHPSGQNFTVVDGIDGYSPAVTIEEIEGGHSVKITDKTHQSGQTFDVMDGNVPIDDTNPSTEKVYSSSKVSSEISILDNDKVDKIEGKGLSANDFTDDLKTKLDGIEANATHTIVDEELSDESTNPVQNKVVSEALDDINQTIAPLPTEATGELLLDVTKMNSEYFDKFVEIVGEIIDTLPKKETMNRLETAIFQNTGLLEDLYNGMNEESEVIF